jgi:hypothetical protein
MTKRNILKNLLENKTCELCGHKFDDKCNRHWNKRNHSEKLLSLNKNNTCGKWINLLAKGIFPIVRRIYPSMIAQEIISVQPILLPKENILYLKPVFTNKIDEGDLKECDGLKKDISEFTRQQDLHKLHYSQIF